MLLLHRTSPRAIAGGTFLSVWLVGCGDAGPSLPARVLVAGGSGQVAPVGTELREPIAVRVVDAGGQPAAGVRVAWESGGDDRLIPESDLTDERGEALARWRLGTSEGERTARASLPGLDAAVFTAIAEPADALPLDQILPLDFATYDGSRQVVHPDYAATPAGAFGRPFHLAITPYPFGNAAFENPSFFDGARRDRWDLTPGAPNPVVRPDVGYLSDPDLVYVPDQGELWLYYRQVTVDNIVRLVRTRDGVTWSAPVEVARAPNHRLISPSVVRRAADDWWMFSVNAGAAGCGAPTTTVEVRRSTDGLRWGGPVTAALAQPGLWAWHIDVQWVPARSAFWAAYNVKTGGGCTTPAVYMAASSDGLAWEVAPAPVVMKGATAELQDIVYRTTFEYDPVTDALTFWYSGARYENGSYRWSAAVERRRRSRVFESTPASADPRELPPAPAPLVDWP